jgi:hypothetical protein
VLNRIKVWVYVLVVVGVGVWSIHSRSVVGSGRAVAIADARLVAAGGQLDVGLKLIQSRSAAVAALAALDRGIIEALSARPQSVAEPKAPKGKGKGKKAPTDPEAEQRQEEALERAVEGAARSAVDSAEKALGFELPQLSFWAAADKGGIAKKLQVGSDGPQKEAVAFLADASKGQPRRGFARVNDGLWYGVGIPMANGAALVLFVPLDEAWARSLQASSGVDVTLSVGLPKAVTTLPPAEAKAIAAAALVRAGAPVDAGKLDRVAAGFELPFKVAPLPLVFGTAPGARAQAVALTGVKDGFAVLSAPVAPFLASVVQTEWTWLVLLAGVLVLGLIVGFLVHVDVPQVPADLLQAAARIERGDFGARVPTMAGKFGTVAAALNRAADAASHVAAAVASPDGTAQFFGRAPSHPEEGGAQSFELPPAPPPASPAEDDAQKAFSTTSRLDGSALYAGSFGAAPATPAAEPDALSEDQEEERHWEQTFDEFLRLREECGESSDGLTFDRFRVKLEKNKETLVQKYGCRTVRFQVYAKEGKAALKATPVK